MKGLCLKFIAALILCASAFGRATLAKQEFFTAAERRFLERAKKSDYISMQVRRELHQKPQSFYRHLLQREITLEGENLERSLDNAWIVRDNFEMQELFFKILEREIAPRSGIHE